MSVDDKVVVTPREHTTRIVIADGDVLTRTGLAGLLEQRHGHQVVGTASDADGVMELVSRHGPDLVVLDAGLRPTRTVEGLEAAARIRAERPETAIMVLAAHVEIESSAELLASGRGVGYLLKHRVVDVDDFIDALHRVVRGGCVLDPVLVHELMVARDRDDPFSQLSRREHDVLALMAQGRSNLGIAHELWVAEGTVEKHVRSILTKLGLGDSPADHRRVLAVIAFLAGTAGDAGGTHDHPRLAAASA
ncbi:response regulator transcription factor [Nocardioides conyzicola]|uniref:Response regulator transcription factor n=1 Tax=Nocardioides conyzicola TaxID=1651781 RepID=A0ABP8X067_9ACTN